MDKYVLYGTGKEAEYFYYNYQNKKSIRFCIDDSGKEFFRGMTVYNLDVAVQLLDGEKIIVAKDWSEYNNVKNSLIARGYIEFKDFLWWKGVDKKMVLFNCNCHAVAYKEYLNNSDDFCKKYYIYEIPSIHKHDHIEENLLRNCDVFIHQVMRVGNSISDMLSDEYCYKRLKKDVQIIIVPNFVGIGIAFFTSGKKTYYINGDDAIFIEDLYIEEAYNEGRCSVKDIREYVLSRKREGIIEIWEKTFEKLVEREKVWSVKISDYIRDNYKKIKMFYDPYHPSYELIQEVCYRLGKYMVLSDYQDITIERKLNWVEMFMYPDVCEGLGLEYGFEGFIRENADYRLSDKPMDIDEYIREYIYVTRGIIID